MTSLSSSVTPADLKAAFFTTALIGRTIREAGPAGIASGILYAALMSKLSKEAFDGAISLLKREGIVSETNHVLVSNI